MSQPSVVLDTNIFIAAGFNARCASARIIEAVKEGHPTMFWTEQTRHETEQVLRNIPPLSWDDFADVFLSEARYEGELTLERYSYVADPADRKFIALAGATGSVLVTADDDLLAHRHRPDAPILTAKEFRHQYLE